MAWCLPDLRSRQPQVDVLRGQLDALRAGHGSVVIVTGPAGIGKTTLLAEAVRLAADGGIVTFRGGGDPAAGAVPLGPILEALVSADEPPLDPARLHELSQSPDQRFWLLREIQEALEQAARHAPLLVVVDDLQWADPATPGALVSLSRRLATHQIGWLLALRRGSGRTPRRTRSAGWSRRARPRSGSARSMRPRSRRSPVTCSAASPMTALREVLGRVDGQPFLLTELLRGLTAENLVTVDGGTARLAAGVRLPRRLVDSVVGQLARLTAPARDAVEMASVLGRSFSLDELAGLLGRPPLELRGEIREAIAAGLLTEDGNRLGFRHDLVREAVDASLPKAVRRSMRRIAVEVMLQHGATAADVACLVMDVAEPGDVASAGLLRRAAAQIGRMSPAVAVPLSRRALDLIPRGGPERGEAVVQAIDLLVQAGRAAEAAKLLTASESDLADSVADAQARLGIAMLMAQYAPALVVEQCQAALRLTGVPPALRVQLLSLQACGLDISGEPAAAAGPVADALAEVALSGDPTTEIITFVPRALLAFAQGDWQRALALASEAVRRQHEPKELRMWVPETWKSLLLISELRLEEANAIIEAGATRGQGCAEEHPGLVHAQVPGPAGGRAAGRRPGRGRGDHGHVRRDRRRQLRLPQPHRLLRPRDIALRTGDPAGLQTARRIAAALYGQLWDCLTTKRLGAWLMVRLDGGPIGPDLLDVLAPGHVHACSPLSHADAVELVRLLLAAGQRPDAAAVTARLAGDADGNPGFPGLRAAALHARALLDDDQDLALADRPGLPTATRGRWSARPRSKTPAGCSGTARRTRRSATWTRR